MINNEYDIKKLSSEFITFNNNIDEFKLKIFRLTNLSLPSNTELDNKIIENCQNMLTFTNDQMGLNIENLLNSLGDNTNTIKYEDSNVNTFDNINTKTAEVNNPQVYSNEKDHEDEIHYG